MFSNIRYLWQEVLDFDQFRFTMTDITNSAVLCDGPVGEKASSLALEEFHLLQNKLREIIRENPEKAARLNEMFRTILKEEDKEEGNQFPEMEKQNGLDAVQKSTSDRRAKIVEKRYLKPPHYPRKLLQHRLRPTDIQSQGQSKALQVATNAREKPRICSSEGYALSIFRS